MATPIILGVGAIAAAVTGRHLIRTGVIRIGGSNAEQWVKGGFRQKMDRAEAIAILGLKLVSPLTTFEFKRLVLNLMMTETPQHCGPRSRMHTGTLC